MRASRCKSCGAPIFFAKNCENAKVVPLDLRPPVYRLDAGGNALRANVAQKDLEDVTPGAYVSHFATCPNASQHSKRGKGGT